LDAAAATEDPEVKKEHYFLVQQRLFEMMPAIPVLIGSSLTQYNTSKVTGWPTHDDLYAYPMAWAAPDSAMVLKAVTPVSCHRRRRAGSVLRSTAAGAAPVRCPL